MLSICIVLLNTDGSGLEMYALTLFSVLRCAELTVLCAKLCPFKIHMLKPLPQNFEMEP